MQQLQKILLLDVDGVIYRDQSVLTHISQKANRYVYKRVPKLKSYKQVSEYNSKLYKLYGHTARGLSVIYNNPNEITDYNNYIYDNNLLSMLRKSLKDIDYTEIKPLINHCVNNDVKMYIFSNAPSYWSYTICEELNILKHIPHSNIFGTDWKLFNNRAKPDILLYDDITKYLKLKESNDNLLIYLVDDSEINLYPLKYNFRWSPILFKKENTLDDIIHYIN